MSIEADDSYLSGWDHSSFVVSSKLTDFFQWTYGVLAYRLVAPLDPNKFDNTTSRTKEIGVRVLIGLGALLGFAFAGTFLIGLGVILTVGSKLFQTVGCYLQKDGFTHIRGKAPESPLQNGQATAMTWSIGGHKKGEHYEKAGVIHWRSRIDRIADEILKANPDVLVLQEVYDTALIEAIIAKLENQYAHFYTHFSPSVWGAPTGCMVIAKCAVQNFSHTEFGDEELKRGFEMFEIKASPTDASPCARIIGTQLTPGKSFSAKRMEQIEKIVERLAKQKVALPTLLVGSLHIDRDSAVEGAILSKYLYHSYRDDSPTYSNALANQWAPLEKEEYSSDFVSLVRRNIEGKTFPVIEKNIRLIDSHLVKAHDHDTKTAVSNCHAVVTTLSGLRAM